MLPLLVADEGDAEDAEVLEDDVALVVVDPPAEIVLVPLDRVSLPAPPCWKTKDVPFIDTCWVWATVVFVSEIAKVRGKSRGAIALDPIRTLPRFCAALCAPPDCYDSGLRYSWAPCRLR